jgi:hypothetical protein
MQNCNRRNEESKRKLADKRKKGKLKKTGVSPKKKRSTQNN